jgi:hypothetical protein
MTDSAQPEPQTPQPDPRFLALVKQEHERLSNVYPTAEDVPGCVSLLDSFLLCNGAPSTDWVASHGICLTRYSWICSHEITISISIPLRRDGKLRDKEAGLYVLHEE